MADNEPAVKSVKLTHPGGFGARTFYNANREPQILRAGDTFEGEVLEADYESVRFLEEGGDTTSQTDNSVTDFPSLDGLNKAQLLDVANDEGYSLMSADASEDDIRTAIEAARKNSEPATDAAAEAQRAESGETEAPASRRRGRAAE